MNEKELKMAMNIIANLIKQHGTMRNFARHINEDVSDVLRWKSGKSKIKTRALVQICKLYGIKPYALRPDWFPENLEFVFK